MAGPPNVHQLGFVWISPLGRTYRAQPPPITNDLPEPRPRIGHPDYPSFATPDDDRPILERPPPPADHPPAGCYLFGMAMTLRLPEHLAAELREAAEEDHRSVHQTVVLAVEVWLAARETAEIKSDPDALRALAAAREEVARGEVSATAEVLAAVAERQRHSA
ncbi:MAG: hypothetical protein ACRDTD_05645 [Pseudonocardiaceae bacterium]